MTSFSLSALQAGRVCFGVLADHPQAGRLERFEWAGLVGVDDGAELVRGPGVEQGLLST